MASEIDTASNKREGSAVERLLARWENKVEFVVTQAEFELSVGQDKSTITERGDVVLKVRTYAGDAAARYPRGEIRLVPFDGEHDRDETGEPIIGAIKFGETNLQIGILLSKSAISDLVAAGICTTGASERRIHVALWSSSRMSSWDGSGQLWVKEATFVIRNIEQPNAT